MDFMSFVCFVVKKIRHLTPSLSPFEAERGKRFVIEKKKGERISPFAF